MKRIVSILFCFFIWSVYAKRVVIVGGGLAGLSAAIEASCYGANVIILEKEERLGGNSIKASSGMNALHTPPQLENNINDSCDFFTHDTMVSGQGYSQKKLVQILVENSGQAWQFLKDRGIQLDCVSKTGGHSRGRTHRAQQQKGGHTTNIGMDIIHTLQTYVENKTSVRIITGAHVIELIKKNKFINGVRYRHKEKELLIDADAVILATGGFCGQTCEGSLLKEVRPDLAYLSTTNGCCAGGEGVRLAEKVGASLVDMEKVQIHPTGLVNPHSPNELRKFLAPESLRASGGILLNKKGRRFTNELGKRDDVTRDILIHCTPYRMYTGEHGPIVSYLILNERAAELFQKKVLSYYQRFGFVQTVSGTAALANLLGVDKAIVRDVFKSYVEAAAHGVDEHGKTTFPVLFDQHEPLYVMLITPCLHYAMGGVRFDETAHVLGVRGGFKNLFAAGEVTGGLHGANRLCGNSLLECVVFGRIAGKNAAT